MELIIGKHYKLKVNLQGRIEEYEGRVLSIDKNEFRFETEAYNACQALTLRNSDVVFSKEIECPIKEEKTHRISSKKKFKDLKESIHPEF